MDTHSNITLELNESDSLDAHQGDLNSRFVDVSLTSNGVAVSLSDKMTAKYDAVVNDVVVASDVSATIDSSNNLIEVELTENMLSISGVMRVDLKVSEGNSLITAQTFQVRIAPSVIDENSRFEPTGSTIQEQIDGKADKETTYTKEETDNLITEKTKGYTKDEIDNLLKAKQDTLIFDSTPQQGHTKNVISSHYLYYLLKAKADSKDIYTKEEIEEYLADNFYNSEETEDTFQMQIDTNEHNGVLLVSPNNGRPYITLTPDLINSINGKADLLSVYTKAELEDYLSENFYDAEDAERAFQRKLSTTEHNGVVIVSPSNSEPYISLSKSMTDTINGKAENSDLQQLVNALSIYQGGTFYGNATYDKSSTIEGTYTLIADVCILFATATIKSGWADIDYMLPINPIRDTATLATDSVATYRISTDKSKTKLYIHRVEESAAQNNGTISFTLVYKYK